MCCVRVVHLQQDLRKEHKELLALYDPYINHDRPKTPAAPAKQQQTTLLAAPAKQQEEADGKSKVKEAAPARPAAVQQQKVAESPF